MPQPSRIVSRPAALHCPASDPCSPPLRVQALRHLQESGHNVEEAARRVQPAQLRPAGRLSHWSDHECSQFERALRLHGKDFGTIQRQMVGPLVARSGVYCRGGDWCSWFR